MTRQRLLFSLALLVAAVPGGRANGFSYYQYGVQKVVWPGKQSLRYLSPSTFPTDSEPDILIREAMGLWNLVPKCDFVYSYARLTQDPIIDHFDGYNDTAAVPASELDPGVLGVTYLVNNAAQWFDTDMLFSDLPEGVGWTMDPNPDCTTVTNPVPSNGFSFLLVSTHEMGHALGLGHDPIGNEAPGTPWFIGTMNPRYPTGGPVGQENIIEVHTDDRSGARFLYPDTAPLEPTLVDVASAGYTTGPTLGKPQAVFFTPASVNPGGQITVRSVIENFGTTNTSGLRQGFYLSGDAVIQTSDLLIGSTVWDLAYQDALEFDATIDLPADMAAGAYYVGTILDDLGQLAEGFEDNNAASYCSTLTVNRLAPVINPLSQQIIPCGVTYTGPTPTVTLPINMAPITWSLISPPAGMTIDSSTGVISWPSPVASPFLYVVTIRATNSAGTSTQNLFLGVNVVQPVIQPVSNELALCQSTYTGPAPQLTSPPCMEPIINWSIDTGPPGLTINHSTGVVSWPNPVAAAPPYTIGITATNAVGNGTRSWQLLVRSADLDGNELLDEADRALFLGVLLGTDSNPTRRALCDFNQSGTADGGDVQPFVECYLGGS